MSTAIGERITTQRFTPYAPGLRIFQRPEIDWRINKEVRFVLLEEVRPDPAKATADQIEIGQANTVDEILALAGEANEAKREKLQSLLAEAESSVKFWQSTISVLMMDDEWCAESINQALDQLKMHKMSLAMIIIDLEEQTPFGN